MWVWRVEATWVVSGVMGGGLCAFSLAGVGRLGWLVTILVTPTGLGGVIVTSSGDGGVILGRSCDTL